MESRAHDGSHKTRALGSATGCPAGMEKFVLVGTNSTDSLSASHSITLTLPFAFHHGTSALEALQCMKKNGRLLKLPAAQSGWFLTSDCLVAEEVKYARLVS